MKTKSFIPPPGSRIVSLRSDGRSKSEKLVKKQLKKAMTKVRKSRVEKDEQLRQLDADWEAVIPRKTLAPKTKRKRALETAQCFEVPWPDVHAEMDLSELITARVSLAVTLTGLFEEQHIGFYKDADSACTALSAIITTLRSPAQSSEDHHNDSIRLSQIMFATTHMESAVELLTCKMLDPTSPQHYLYGGGPLLLRIDTGPHWKSIENKISVEVQAVKTLVVIGDMLVRGIKDGQWEFVRGVLESVGVFGSAKGNESDTRRIHLLTKTDFLRCIEKRKDTYTDFRMNESRAQAIVNTLLLCLSFPSTLIKLMHFSRIIILLLPAAKTLRPIAYSSLLVQVFLPLLSARARVTSRHVTATKSPTRFPQKTVPAATRSHRAALHQGA